MADAAGYLILFWLILGLVALAVTLWLSADTISVMGGVRQFVQDADTPNMQKMLDDYQSQP